MLRTPFLMSLVAVALGGPAVGGCGTVDPEPVITASTSPTQLAPGADTTMTVEVDNFNLADPATHTTPVEGEGHYHIYFDAVAGDALAIDHRRTVSVTIPSDATGTIHRLIVSLRNNDHSEIDPPVRKEVIVELTQ
jgi:hypothetical protein